MAESYNQAPVRRGGKYPAAPVGDIAKEDSPGGANKLPKGPAAGKGVNTTPSTALGNPGEGSITRTAGVYVPTGGSKAGSGSSPTGKATKFGTTDTTPSPRGDSQGKGKQHGVGEARGKKNIPTYVLD